MGIRLALACLALQVSVVGTVAAQDEDLPLGEFSVQRYSPAVGAGNYFMIESAAIAGHMVPSAGLSLDYAHDAFAIYDATCAPDDDTDCETNGVNTRLVRNLFMIHLHGSFSLYDRVQFGLVLPLGISAGDNFSTTYRGEPYSLGGGSTFGLGDPRILVKGNIFDQGEYGLEVGASVYLGIPLGQATAEESFIGGDGPMFGGHGIIGYVDSSGFSVHANVGGQYRKDVVLFSTEQGPQLTWGAGAGYRVTPLISVLAEIEGGSSFSSEVDENPVEIRAGARMRQGDFTFHAAAGTGIISGVGVPSFRLVGGAQWAPVRMDSDGDGILDEDDGCPDEPEDEDDWMDDDGCPEPDNDGDGMLDPDDPCPDEPEDMDDYQDDDGCPDTDNDGDGVSDGFDSCPNVPEDMDGDRDDDGCPDDDTDRDGIPDSEDQCPTEPEDTDGFGDDDGCPETDFDNDGVPDDTDECPDVPETINGIQDEDGCPEGDSDGDGVVDGADRCPNEAETLNGVNDDDGCPDGEAVVEIQGNQIRLLQQINFATNSDRIRGRRSFQILDAVATILTRHPEYRRVRIEGHTDDRGGHDHNTRLSNDRANAVMAALVERGIAPTRLHAIGHGPDRPIESNDSRQGRAANRRVEFHIENE